MVKTNDLILAESYKMQHEPYSSDSIRISKVWRDIDGFLCVRYITMYDVLLDWYHYNLNDFGELVWW